ncbi:putative orfan [Tupanvirus soda lake]|uniref:Orfan n=2 Tax=Tupanvirus TaxID=2094720 RepID=A0AC62ACN3_9VIRU|nr:putative orfan [Tupanvirus soda lake]QKU35560.1 putative orfan [Tupanvirus soda lake]
MTTSYTSENQYVSPKPSAPYIDELPVSSYEQTKTTTYVPPISTSYQAPVTPPQPIQLPITSNNYTYRPQMTQPSPYATSVYPQQQYTYPYYYSPSTNPIYTTKIYDDHCHNKNHCRHDDRICWCTII